MLRLRSRHQRPDPRPLPRPGEAITADFLRRLPEIRRLLALDAVAAYEGDPAAPTPVEAIFCYPGVLAVTSHRIAHELYRLDVPLIPRIITEHAHSLTGIDIHPGATIGEQLLHRPRHRRGDRRDRRASATACGSTRASPSAPRASPSTTTATRSRGSTATRSIEDDVTIYSGATILGRHHRRGLDHRRQRVWLTRDVPPSSRVSQGRPRTAAFENGGGI